MRPVHFVFGDTQRNNIHAAASQRLFVRSISSWRVVFLPTYLCCLAGMLGGLSNKAGAIDFNSGDSLITTTVAGKERNRDYDNRRRFGAERVLERDRSYVQPDGVRYGRFVFFPSIEANGQYDSNIFSLPNQTVDDYRSEIIPEVSIVSDFSRHELNFSFGGRFVEFLENRDQSYIDGKATVDAALHIDHAHTLAISARSILGHEERGSQTTPVSAAEPVPSWLNEVSVGFTRDVGRLYGTLSASYAHRNFFDVDSLSGTRLDQDLRDSTEWTSELRGGYRFSPGFEALGVVRYLRQDPVNENSFIASNGYEALAGLRFEMSPLWQWTVLGGYGIRDYDDQSLDQFQTSLVEGEVIWLATQRLTVTGSVSRQIDTLDTPGPGGRVISEGRVRFDYDLANNAVLQIGGGVSNSDFIDDIRNDFTYTGSIGFEYFMDKNWAFTIKYDYDRRESNQDDFDFTRHRIGVGATLRF